MADDNVTAADTGTVETLAKTIKSQRDFHAYWMSAIELATKTETDWRKDAKAAIDQFRTETDYRGPKFNILYANIQTTCPAIYNSEPAADVRPRFGEATPNTPPMMGHNGGPEMQDPQIAQMMQMQVEQAKAVADKTNSDRRNVSQSIERAISVQSDMYDYDDAMQSAVKDRELIGRAVTRLRVNLVNGPDVTDPQTGNAIPGAVVSKHISWEPVIWDEFRIGPAKRWPDMPWIAFLWLYTRDELVGLNATIGEKVNLDATVEGAPDKTTNTPDTFKRARVWEIWDRGTRKVIYLAESYDDGPLKIEDDPYKLRGFFPVPKPLYAIKTTDSMVPICPFVVWKAQQEEMNSLTRRISALIKVIRWRGVYDGAFEKAVQAMKNLDDGEMAPAPDAARALVQGQIEKAFWLMPIQQAIETIKALYEAREVCKQTIYELTGVADILRGSTKANETLGAQKLKAEWGSLRLQSAQRDIQVHARDLMRLTSDLMAEHFTPEEWEAMTGIALTPEQQQLMKTDIAREFSIDIETDGTIKADLGRAQENVAGFVAGFGQFIQSIGPAVQAGMITPEEAVGLLRTFARNFKLGREAENILDDMQRRLEQKAKEPPQPPPVDPQIQIEAEKAKADAMERQGRLQLDQQEALGKHTLEQQRMQQEAEYKQAVLALEAQYKGAELDLKKQELALKQADIEARANQHRETLAVDAFHKVSDRQHQAGMEREKFGRERAVADEDAMRGMESAAQEKADEAEDKNENKALIQAILAQGQAIGGGLEALGEAIMAPNRRSAPATTPSTGKGYGDDRTLHPQR